jgi:hypothetical protein
VTVDAPPESSVTFPAVVTVNVTVELGPGSSVTLSVASPTLTPRTESHESCGASREKRAAETRTRT